MHSLLMFGAMSLAGPAHAAKGGPAPCAVEDLRALVDAVPALPADQRAIALASGLRTACPELSPGVGAWLSVWATGHPQGLDSVQVPLPPKRRFDALKTTWFGVCRAAPEVLAQPLGADPSAQMGELAKACKVKRHDAPGLFTEATGPSAGLLSLSLHTHMVNAKVPSRVATQVAGLVSGSSGVRVPTAQLGAVHGRTGGVALTRSTVAEPARSAACVVSIGADAVRLDGRVVAPVQGPGIVGAGPESPWNPSAPLVQAIRSEPGCALGVWVTAAGDTPWGPVEAALQSAAEAQVGPVAVLTAKARRAEKSALPAPMWEHGQIGQVAVRPMCGDVAAAGTVALSLRSDDLVEWQSGRRWRGTPSVADTPWDRVAPAARSDQAVAMSLDPGLPFAVWVRAADTMASAGPLILGTQGGVQACPETAPRLAVAATAPTRVLAMRGAAPAASAPEAVDGERLTSQTIFSKERRSSTPAPASAKIALADVSGTTGDVAAMQQRLAAMDAQVAYCYRRLLASVPAAQGTLGMRIETDGTGAVRAAKVVGDAGSLAPVGMCLSARLQRQINDPVLADGRFEATWRLGTGPGN